MIGSLIAGSGFEDIIFQSGVCTSVSLQGVLAGSHYNRGWIVHNAFAEALERLLFKRFVYEEDSTIPDSFQDLNDLSIEQLDSLSNDESIAFTEKYQRYRLKIQEGTAGKTAQFWMIYLDLMKAQHMTHSGVQDNDIDMIINAWLKFLPIYFVFNKINYARYGSYYAYTLIHMERLYPGLKELIKKKGLSVQAQEAYPLRTSINQRGEQTINRDEKTSLKINYIQFYLQPFDNKYNDNIRHNQK